MVVAEAEVMCKLADREPPSRARRLRSLVHADPSHRDRRSGGPHRSNRRHRPLLRHRRRRSRSAPRTRLMAHVYVEGPTWIGEDNLFYPLLQRRRRLRRTSSTTASAPRRASATATGSASSSPSTAAPQAGGLLTRIGDDNLLRPTSHVAHDCHVGNHTVLSQRRHARRPRGHRGLGRQSAPSPACTSSAASARHAMIGGYSVITQDVLPFSMTVSPRERQGLRRQQVGLERRGFSTDSHRSPPEGLPPAHPRRPQHHARPSSGSAPRCPPAPEIDELIEFIRASERGVIK